MEIIGHLEMRPCEFKYKTNPDDPNSPYEVCGVPTNKFGDKFLCLLHNPVALKKAADIKHKRIEKEFKRLEAKIKIRKRVKVEEDAFADIFNDKESFLSSISENKQKTK